ncbi:hypothetical protein Tco_0116670 [Tanacetum coccineum]
MSIPTVNSVYDRDGGSGQMKVVKVVNVRWGHAPTRCSPADGCDSEIGGDGDGSSQWVRSSLNHCLW